MTKSKDQITQIPNHVAIIMDGNGRWAKKRKLPRIEGHRKGVNNVKKIVRHASDLGIKYLTLFAFSVENWNRPKLEVDALMQLLLRFIKSQTKEMKKNKIRLGVIGRIKELPSKVVKALEKSMDETKHFDHLNLVLALNYGSRTEVLDAVKSFSTAFKNNEESIDDLDWNRFSNYLYTDNIPDPDLIIRTSGEKRISNFLLLQGAYSEYYFTDKYWPDFHEQELSEAIESYKKRERRFGKTGEQVNTN